MEKSHLPRGRPRAAEIDQALERAFAELINQIPLRDFSVQKLVSRAGTSRDAFYRRYASLGHFVIEVILIHFATDPSEDTGSLHGDLSVILRAQREMYTHPLAKGLVPLVLEASFRDPMTAEALSERFIQPRRAAVVKVLNRAVLRGEIEPISDAHSVVDQIYAPMFFRAVLPGMNVIDETYDQAIMTAVFESLGATTGTLQTE